MSSCDEYRDAVSAYADGETAPISRTEVSRHLEGCAACGRYASELVELHHRVQAATTGPVPDLTRDILVAVPPADLERPARRHRQRRALLAVAGLVQLVLAVPAVAGLGSHVGRDLASFELALAGALLFVAWRPTAALGLLPMVGLVAAVGVAGAVIDAAGGVASLTGELRHLLPAITVLPLWRLSRASPRPGRDAGAVPA